MPNSGNVPSEHTPNPTGNGFYWGNLAYLAISLVVVIFDQWTKHWATLKLVYAQPEAVMPFLNWTLLHNYGAAFSFLADAGGWQRHLFTGLACVASVLFTVWLVRVPPHAKVLILAIVLVLGGAIGNLIDRASMGYVVDFIHVYYAEYNFPAFNIADIAISLGAFLMIVDMLFFEKKRTVS